MIDLHTAPTPNGHKVSIMLEETGLPYKVIPINLHERQQFTREFTALNPNCARISFAFISRSASILAPAPHLSHDATSPGAPLRHFGCKLSDGPSVLENSNLSPRPSR